MYSIRNNLENFLISNKDTLKFLHFNCAYLLSKETIGQQNSEYWDLPKEAIIKSIKNLIDLNLATPWNLKIYSPRNVYEGDFFKKLSQLQRFYFS